MTLRIGRRSTHEVEGFAQASEVYARARDESGEGYHTFPFGTLTDGKKRYRVSYNGRVWDGGTLVYESRHSS